MKKIGLILGFILLVVCSKTYAQKSYVNVYGRIKCGYTVRMINYLQGQSIPFQFFSVDDRKASAQLHAKMRAAGINVRSYGLPVVEVNRQVFIRPEGRKVKTIYDSGR